MVFRTRDLLVRQRTQLIYALLGHLAEYGWVAPRGTAHISMLADQLEEEEMASSLPQAARAMLKVMTDLMAELDGQVAELDKEIARRAREDDAARRLMTIPGIGPITATAIIALAPSVETFSKGVTSQPGSGLRRSSARRAESRSSARSRRWANEPSGGCSSSEPARWKQAALRGAPAASWPFGGRFDRG